MKIQYFISYFYSEDKNGQSGFGNSVIKSGIEIKELEHINAVSEKIEKDRNLQGVIVLNYREM